MCLYTESFRRLFFNNNRNILILKCENTTFENRSYAARKPPNILDEWNGCPEIFSFFKALEITRQYLLL